MKTHATYNIPRKPFIRNAAGYLIVSALVFLAAFTLAPPDTDAGRAAVSFCWHSLGALGFLQVLALSFKLTVDGR